MSTHPYSDWQRLRPLDVWEADVSSPGPNPEPLSGAERRQESASACSDAECVCGEVSSEQSVRMSCDKCLLLCCNFRSRGHIGTSEKFRNFSNTFTQRFQKKAPFFSWCWGIWICDYIVITPHPNYPGDGDRPNPTFLKNPNPNVNSELSI